MVNPTVKQKNKMSLFQQIDDWNLSEPERQLIFDDRFFLNHLIVEKNKFPLPAFYIPNTIEIRFDNVLYLKQNWQEIIYLKKKPYNLEPLLIEWRFDDECAWFQSKSEILIDRVSELEIFNDLKSSINTIFHNT